MQHPMEGDKRLLCREREDKSRCFTHTFGFGIDLKDLFRVSKVYLRIR